MKKIPQYVLDNTKTYTSRAFKKQKRQQIRIALKAIDDLRQGCAFLPRGSHDVDAAGKALKIAKDACSVKKWGR